MHGSSFPISINLHTSFDRKWKPSEWLKTTGLRKQILVRRPAPPLPLQQAHLFKPYKRVVVKITANPTPLYLLQQGIFCTWKLLTWKKCRWSGKAWAVPCTSLPAGWQDTGLVLHERGCQNKVPESNASTRNNTVVQLMARVTSRSFLCHRIRTAGLLHALCQGWTWILAS